MKIRTGTYNDLFKELETAYLVLAGMTAVAMLLTGAIIFVLIYAEF